MPVMSALVIAVLIGLAAVWAKAKGVISLLNEFQKIVLTIVSKIIIPLLPFFIATTFCCLAYDGTITKQLPIFLLAVVIVIVGHFIWMAVLYGIAGIYTKKNPFRVFKHYGPACLTAVGTMSSAATLAVALRCAHKSDALREDMVDFGIPLFANIHLCGSVLTETFFCMIVSMVLTGALPSVGTMILFCALLAIFAIGAPGVSRRHSYGISRNSFEYSRFWPGRPCIALGSVCNSGFLWNSLQRNGRRRSYNDSHGIL